MKNLFYIVLFGLLTTVCVNAQTIVTIRSGQYRITADLLPIKTNWEKVLKDEGITASLVNFVVKSGADKTTGKTYYFLYGTNKDQSVKVAQGLKLKGATLVFLSKNETPAGIMTCTGCVNGCVPAILNGNWICDPACNKSDSECIKIETIIQ
jgi:hypothetical protein